VVGGPLTLRIAFAIGTLLILATGFGCDPGFPITYVNETDRTIIVYTADNLKPNEYDVVLKPHSTVQVNMLEMHLKGVVIGRDEEGNLLFRKEIGREQLEAQDNRFVITQDMLSPIPIGTAPALPSPQ
jgi:hypothetical protein